MTEPAVPAWPTLTPDERRVLGVLIEKQKTSKSADAYPLTLNALVVGCNQKSNREPVMELDEDDVEPVLSDLSKRHLVTRIGGGRVDRWKHELYERWKVDRVEMAILAELLLRGPQTEGDLRSRAARMETIESLDALRALIKPLAERRLVVYLTPEKGRGVVITHGFHEPSELLRLRAEAVHMAMSEPSRPQSSTPAPELLAARADIHALQMDVVKLQGQVESLAKQLADLQRELGTKPN